MIAGRRSRAAASMITSRLVAVSGLGVNDEPAIWFSREFLEDSLDIVGVPHAEGSLWPGRVARLYATIRRVSALRRRVSGVGERVAGAGSARSDAPYGAGLGALGARRGKPQPVPAKRS